MRRFYLALSVLSFAATPSPTRANDWQKFYTATPIGETLPATVDPDVFPTSGDLQRDLETMWRRGYVAIGYTSFSTSNGKTADATRFAKKLKARFLIVQTRLASSSTSSIPLTMPSVQTSYTNGTASAYGSGGYASGRYSGTTTTYGSQTTYIPITVERFDKHAVYFQEVPKIGTGILSRDLTTEEMTALGTRRAFAVQFVRDGSPAYHADIFPNDMITHVNGLPADMPTWQSAIRGPQPMLVRLLRAGQPRELQVTVPEDWRPK